ncbi:MAG TPA: VOC family protein [Candidatus Acidoferrum sp.]|nr:VOC family protein [Candidatus Acidoferrum sp.]
MQINPYLVFDGQCEAAFKFYERLLGGKITGMMTFGNSPAAAQSDPDWRDKVMHVHMTVGSWVLMGSDAPRQHFQKPQGFAVSLGVKGVEDGRRIFNALAENGVVQMPFEKTFWSPGFGMLTDRFGIPWMVNCE